MRRTFQVLGLILAAALLGLIGWFAAQKDSPFYQPIQDFKLVSPIAQITHEEVSGVVGPYLGNSFWDIPLNQIQAELTHLDWVRSSEVKRKWPNLLYISITEHVPVARWGEAGLVNRSGNVFFPHSIADFQNLVRLEGALDKSQDILRAFVQLQRQFTVLDLVVESVGLSISGIWNIQVLNGPKIVLDSLDYERKLQRFILAYPKLESSMRKSARVYDLRYSNGFIIAQN